MIQSSWEQLRIWQNSMKLPIKFIVIVLIFSAGAASGYFLSTKKSVQIKNAPSEVCNIPSISDNATAPTFNSANQKVQTGMKINLLQDYMNFIFLPKEKVGDPKQYTDSMTSKVAAIRDDELAAKFIATGTDNTGEREQMILDFMNAIIESIKKDLN